MSSLGAAVSLTMAVLTTSICSAFLLRESCVYVHALCNCRCVDRERAMVKKPTFGYSYWTGQEKWEWIRASKMRKQQSKKILKRKCVQSCHFSFHSKVHSAGHRAAEYVFVDESVYEREVGRWNTWRAHYTQLFFKLRATFHLNHILNISWTVSVLEGQLWHWGEIKKQVKKQKNRRTRPTAANSTKDRLAPFVFL